MLACSHYRNVSKQTTRIVLRYGGKLAHLEQPSIPLPLPVPPQAVRDTYEVLYDLQNEVACLMLGNTLDSLGYAIPKEVGVGLILNSLNKDYDQFVQNYNMHNMGKSIVELHAMLKLQEEGIPKKAETSAMLAIREDSFYLWHCRLDHINNKHMDKLQRDGILQLTHDESLEKCKSCIFRKMARKPFPHQVERANDLLGLIHTDVCGPFRTVLREGSSYFIIFTNDLIRYGYVYLMKHKHEVFETFKVFKNEVEIQLRKKIKAIRSDRGVGSKWIFKKKTVIDGKVHTFKAHRVAKGYTQTYGVAYGTFSPVTYIRAIRILLAITAFYDYEIWQIDQNPGEIYWTAVKTILKYLRITKDMVLVYGAKPEAKLKVSCNANASFQTGKDDTKSQMGYAFIFNGGAVEWKSAKQSTTVMSTEAEYIAAAEASMEANLDGSQTFSKEGSYIRKVIQEREIVLKKVHTDNNVADPFRKPMPFNKHYEHAMAIGIVSASSLM
uniref:Retrotransposon protein, putative, Ty1-copia subclass n=1 Tax=Tanacetum cinerariifolium TaxID=118510 RepID=A0A6L2M5X7_TANCI|nr:retrotransposon protein, putative, Ty1-copia subclass [Tanacetum cinerariifolium]